MKPEESESTADFVLRVDQKRKLINFTQTECLDHFTRFFDPSFASECDRHRRNALMRDEDFEWQDVVKIARDFKYGAKIEGTANPVSQAKSGNPFLPATTAPASATRPATTNPPA